jgi:hypothetical protein
MNSDENLVIESTVAGTTQAIAKFLPNCMRVLAGIAVHVTHLDRSPRIRGKLH